MRRFSLGASIFVYAISIVLGAQKLDRLAKCPGYNASNFRSGPDGLTADLSLAGPACNVFGEDLIKLVLKVTYETSQSFPVGMHEGFR